MMYSFGKTKKGYIGKNSNPGPGKKLILFNK